MNEQILNAAGFSEEVENIKAGKCPICNEDVDVKDFRDELSRKEFKISGMCQKCQDEIFS